VEKLVCIYSELFKKGSGSTLPVMFWILFRNLSDPISLSYKSVYLLQIHS
jgi:hypothetical protein